jgi:DNA mismatch repair protein MutS2
LLVLKGAEVVPLNLKLGTSYNTLLITGPNMGGKTVALKTCGLLSLMALSGIPIPAGPDTEIPLFKEIYADMGDESSIEDGISTFSSHLKNLMEMEKNAGDGTLILIDEIMRGTDLEEGNCLASAFLEDFTAKNALVIATTHSSALKLFVHKMDKMENGGMEFKSGFPTYKLNIGLPGSSYGIETAENMRVPQKIVKRAREFMTRDVFNVDILLRELEERRVKLKEREGKISEREEEVRKTLKAMRIREMELMKKQENMKMEARRVVEDGRRFIENAVKEIREKKGEKDVIKRVKREIRKRLEESTPVVKGGLSFKVGDYVIIRGSGIEGRVIKITDKRAVLSVDGVQFTVPKSSLSKGIQKEKREEPIVKFTRDIDIDYEINLRRLEREEALEKLRRYIDNAELVGLKNFKVIHGVGKGILKRAVWEELKNDERIDSFSLGELYEGGDGVTIVTMRE